LKSDDMLTLTEAISMCQGLTTKAAGREVRILRLRPGSGIDRQVIKVDVQHMFETLDFRDDQYLRPRDFIVVPTLGGATADSEFLVLGDVAKPGFHPYSKDLDVIRAVTLAGGASRLAKWAWARLLRHDSAGSYNVIPIDLSRLFGAADMSMNVKVQPGDILFIPSSEQASRGQVYLLGEVAKPGAVFLPLDQDMTLAKTILDAGGFAKFANGSKVKILRTAPDGSKQTMIADVESVLKTGDFDQDIPLVSGDVIIVPEKMLSF
jgi:protein involved in polysaccharide export with SLBB domain